MAKKRDYKTDIKYKLIDLGYDIISKDEEYINMTTNLRFKCNKCGEIYERTPKSALKSNCYCQKCTQQIIVGKKLHDLKSAEDKINNFMNMHGFTEYVIKENSSEITFKCKECGKTITRKFDVISKCSYPFICKECSNKIEKPQLNSEIINERLRKMHSNTICIEEGQFRIRDKVHFKCGNCGKVFVRKPNTVLSQKYFMCSYCSKRISNGEKIIINILEENCIDYVFQKCFDNCKNKLPLPFDFYLADKNILIEYDGILHYEDRFGTLERQKENDIIKDKYCFDNNITLIRIPYWEDIEENILKIIYDNTVPS